MQTVLSNSANRKQEEGFRGSLRFVIFALILTFNSCSPSDTVPARQQAREFVEGNLRRIGTPIKNFSIREGRLGERSGATFYCFNWYGDFVWDYPKGVDKKLYGYVKFMKTNEGWKADHMNYRGAARSLDAELKCE